MAFYGWIILTATLLLTWKLSAHLRPSLVLTALLVVLSAAIPGALCFGIMAAIELNQIGGVQQVAGEMLDSSLYASVAGLLLGPCAVMAARRRSPQVTG